MSPQDLCYIRVGRLALTLTFFIWLPILVTFCLLLLGLVTGTGLAALGMAQ